MGVGARKAIGRLSQNSDMYNLTVLL